MKFFWNTFYNLSESCYWQLVQLLCTYILRFSCFSRGINVGAGSRFVGLAKIKRSNKSDITIGKNCIFRSSKTSNLIGINRKCIITATSSAGSSLVIGDDCGFSGVVISSFNNITIGDNVRCGANVLITDSDWHLDDERLGGSRPVKIENNVFLGVNVIILKGVTIGKNSVIGAGSVVVSDIPSNVIAVGNPCRVVKALYR